MSNFQVTPEVVGEMATRLGTVPAGVAEFSGRAGRHASAGHGTPGAAAVSGLADRWARVLPLFALSGARLSAAVAGAAAEYAASDRAVASEAGAAKG